jgi:N-acyl-D-amino-acid deacylase
MRSQNVEFDIVIIGGQVIDGSGRPSFRADVGIVGDRVVAVSDLPNASTRMTIDADGLIVCPGFIDMHAHSDLPILSNPEHRPKVFQGVTLDVLGQDGLSYAPVTEESLIALRSQLRAWNGDPEGFNWNWRSVDQYLERLDGGVAINTAYLIPHGTLRLAVMGYESRPPSVEEMDRMVTLLAEGLQAGAVGMSAGLSYVPATYASDAELVELCKTVAAFGGYYSPHHRNYGITAMEAYRDCIEIARSSGVALHLAHAHLGFAVNRGRAPELIDLIDEAISEGIDLTFDTYPYLAGSTYLHALLPTWCQEGGREPTLARLSDTSNRTRLKTELEILGSDGWHGITADWSTVVISGVTNEQHRALVGKSIDEIAVELGTDPFDAYCQVLIADELGTSCLMHIGNEENVRLLMTHPVHTAGSDGILVGDQPHPRGWGTFPRYLGVYARDLGILTLEQAVRKMTSVPARRLGFADRGILHPGAAADVVCFDPLTVSDTATYATPRQHPIGIPHVIVNGRVVVADGSHTGDLPGRALRRGQGASPRSNA